jgi:excisionase family DNA binding protein
MTKKFLTTFEAAKLISVTPDTVLKWIKSGVLDARRTPGGHHRIDRKSIEVLLNLDYKSKHPDINQDKLQYCWEYNSHFHNCPDECQSCVVYKTLAKRCYKMKNLPNEFGHLKLYCNTTCEECNYYKYIRTNN